VINYSSVIKMKGYLLLPLVLGIFLLEAFRASCLGFFFFFLSDQPLQMDSILIAFFCRVYKIFFTSKESI
jgi:hypothetical protein